ncbi:NAD-dependent epimerase/dehydratase family protein [Amphritea sp. HPY]|uniref:NAD-dependent epimerase/dehydratase family protein n=1 Tax=Amphritea sp. HPY TaxID=3421652 RepID=UPI003D7E0577
MNVLITGATGFVGSRLFERTQAMHKFQVFGTSRKACEKNNIFNVGMLNSETDWSSVLRGVDVVVHTAAMIDATKYNDFYSESELRQVNVGGTMHLANEAAAAGVKRFVFISTIKVNGESTEPDLPFSPLDLPSPEDWYGVSKMEAEQGLRSISDISGIEVVIIRPPLVYGPGVKGGFQSLMKLANTSYPLPLGGINNSRSFVSLDNLVDLIITCLDHSKAAGEMFLICDGKDLSTSELLDKLRTVVGKPANLFWFPAVLLKMVSILLGKRFVYDKLFSSLQVDDSYTRRTLDWHPPLTLDEGLSVCSRSTKES